MICRGPMPSIIAWRCLFSIIFLGDSSPLHSSKELENMIKLGWFLHSEMLSFSPKTRLPIRIWKCFSWTKTQADLQPDVFGLSIHAEIHLIIKMDAIAIKYSITNPPRNYLTKFAVQFIPTSLRFIFSENSYSYRPNNFAFAQSVPIIYCYGYLCRK